MDLLRFCETQIWAMDGKGAIPMPVHVDRDERGQEPAHLGCGVVFGVVDGEVGVKCGVGEGAWLGSK
jgi:hypothetical protein